MYESQKLFRISMAIESLDDTVIDQFSMGLSLLEKMQQETDADSRRYCVSGAPSINQGRGRPKLITTAEQLKYLLKMNFKGPKIAELL